MQLTRHAESLNGAQQVLGVGLIATGSLWLPEWRSAWSLVQARIFGRHTDARHVRLVAVRALFLALAITGALDPGLTNAMLAIGVTGILVFARLANFGNSQS